MKKIVVFIDSGDTLIDEGTEVKTKDLTVIHAQMIDGAREALTTLHDLGYKIALVADGTKQSFDNIYDEQKLQYCFDAKAISGEIGHEKPHESMFRTAMDALGLTDDDKYRIVMIGNNIKRDIIGAKRMGIRSVLLTYSPRYNMVPENAEETPDFTISSPKELVGLIERLNDEITELKR